MSATDPFRLPIDNPSTIRTDVLDTFPYDGNDQIITYSTREFSAVCPFSGLPDIAEIIVKYIPDKKCLELKSFKYYLVSFRSVGIYQEHATDRIFKDLETVLAPKWLQVETRYATRGGIDAVCVMSSGKAPV